jgi:hypothetical protein
MAKDSSYVSRKFNYEYTDPWVSILTVIHKHMKTINTKTTIIIFIVFATALTLVPLDVLARAGGGRSKGGGIIVLILYPFFLLYSGVVTYYAIKKYKQAKALLNKIAMQDTAWNIDSIKSRIEEAYFAIQHSWRDRTIDSAREYISDRLYRKHKAQIEGMIQSGTQNVMLDITLSSVKVLEVLDYADDAKDRFIALIEGAMIDKLVNSQGVVIDGDDKKRRFKELWKFKREPHGWVLDEIDSDVSISDLHELKAWSESVS